MAALLSKPLSVKCNTYSMMKGLSHNEVLSELEKTIPKADIKSIQIKERECVVSVMAKNKLILSSTNIQYRQVNFQDVECLITSVTIKDTRYEMPDSTITSFMSQYREIISDSVKHGKIKDTDIENGTRYMKLLNCVPVLPLTGSIGRFPLRLFADNNRTPCRYCGETNHPYFKCSSKPQRNSKTEMKCWNCNGPHLKKDCPNPSLCFHCEKEGHAACDCPRKMYIEYFADILEGNESSDRESLVSECSFQTGVDDRKQRIDSGPDDDEIQALPQEPEAVT